MLYVLGKTMRHRSVGLFLQVNVVATPQCRAVFTSQPRSDTAVSGCFCKSTS